MKASNNNIITICHLAVTATAAFRPIEPLPALQRRPSPSSVALMAHHHYHPFHHHPYYNNPQAAPFFFNNKQRPGPTRPLSVAVDADILTDAEKLTNEQQFSADTTDAKNDDSEGWNKRRANTKDFRPTKEFRTANGDSTTSSSSTAPKKQSEVINFPLFEPLKSADENNGNDPYLFQEEYDEFMRFLRQHPFPPPPPPPGIMSPMSDIDFEFNDFEDEYFDIDGMPPLEFEDEFFDMPPPPPPHFFSSHPPNNPGPMFMSDEIESEENYVDRVDFADHGRPVNDRDNTGSVDTFFSDRPVATANFNNRKQQRGGVGGGQRRGGPSVYTQEEEELIASMGGMGPRSSGRPSTQEFAEAGTQSAVRKSRSGPMPPQYREEGYLGDSTLKEISMDYGVPVTYLADVLATWGVPIPIDPNNRLGDMVTGEQAFAVLEAIHTLDVAELHDRYAEDDLMNLCEYYDVDIKDAFDFCMERGWALPFGVRTFLRVEQEEELLDALVGDGGMY